MDGKSTFRGFLLPFQLFFALLDFFNSLGFFITTTKSSFESHIRSASNNNQFHRQLNRIPSFSRSTASMCINILLSCSYPHHEPVASVIFDPAKKDSWKICDRPQPWGRLSCGALEVHHSISYARTTISFNTLLEHANKPNLIPTPISTPSSPSSIDPNLAGAGYVETAICQWCTAVLNMHAHKFKSVQQDAKKVIDKLEKAMDTEPKLRDLDKKIVEMEAALETMRADAWIERKQVMENVEC